MIAALREALRVSPNNLPLRRHLAETLMSLGDLEAAESEYRDALQLSPDNVDLKIGLARAFFQQEKLSHALVIVEELLKQPQTPASVYVLHARLLLKRGDVDRAVRQYKMAVFEDPDSRDTALEERLGINVDEAQSEVLDGRIRAHADEDAEAAPDVMLERPDVAFNDVGGMDHVKNEIRMKIIHPIAHPEIYAAYGKKIGGGILMFGPPGCGKTHLARATAGEVNAAFLAIGISDVLDMWIGQSERNLHDIFEHARSHTPCVLFFDEVDALGARRSDMRQSAGRQLINQFLSELDGINGNNEGVLILAATNAPWHLDTAFRRPGRFDRVIFVPPPDAPARAAILRIMLRGKPVADIDVDHVAAKTDGYSGADLKAVVDIAVEAKLQSALASGSPTPITTKDLLKSTKSAKPSTKEWFASARNYALYSNEGGLYDDVLSYLKIR